jgi:hypothetical protein
MLAGDANTHRHGGRLHSHPYTGPHRHLRLVRVAQADGHRDLQGQGADRGEVEDVLVGSVSVTLNAGQSRTVRIALNVAGRRLLAKRRALKVKLSFSQALSSESSRAILAQALTFKAAKHR